MPNRRNFLKTLSSLPLVGGLLAPKRTSAASDRRDYFKELGVRPIINAAGRRIAELVGCEAAMVTAGAASALTLGTAACMTGSNPDLIHRLPDTTGMKNEVIIQKSHHFGYEHAVRNCGIRFVEVETEADLERAVNERTAMMLFLNYADPTGQTKADRFAELGRKYSVPTFNDCAADVPPTENLSRYLKTGFSLVTFSGGKGLRGPQSAGLLLGRKDLIAAARLNGPPNSDTIGRGMKVNKEEMVAMMVAVELYLKRDHAADEREWRRRIDVISRAVSSIPTVSTETYVPEIANHVPHMRIRWEENRVKISSAEVQRQLREGTPSIEPVPGPKDVLAIGVWMMQQGDEKIVARRLRDILRAAA